MTAVPAGMRGIAAGLALGLVGCAAVQTQIESSNREEQRALRAVLRSSQPPAMAAQWLGYARRHELPPQAQLAASLEAARLSFTDAARGEEQAALLYNAAIRQVFDLLEEKEYDLQPEAEWNRIGSLEIVRGGKAILDPSQPELLVPADQVAVRGLLQRTVQPGVGLPFCAWFPQDAPFLEGEPGIPSSGLAMPATAVLTFSPTRSGYTARLEWIRTLERDWIAVDGRRRTLAADFSAPLAVWVARGRNRVLDFDALLRTDRHFPSAALVQFQPYEADKIPLVFVHGLMARPEAWLQAVNILLGDPEIRAKYQFWFYLYPTGLPVWASAAGLRKELNRFNAALGGRANGAGPHPPLNQKVLIGHSMGGLICSLLVRDGGTYLWGQFSDTEFDMIPFSDQTRELIRRQIFFEARDDVAEVVFVATPHRGSPLALRPISGFAASLIRLPFTEFNIERRHILPLLRGDKRQYFRAPANSIRFLRANSPLLLSILDLPRDPAIPFHSIIGDRGRNDSPDGSDGIVPYWSAHLEDAVSETIVPSGHGANEHPDGVRAISDILKSHAQSSPAIRRHKK